MRELEARDERLKPEGVLNCQAFRQRCDHSNEGSRRVLYNVFVVAEESLFSSIANAQNEGAVVRNTLSFNLSTNLIILYYFNQHADTQART